MRHIFFGIIAACVLLLSVAAATASLGSRSGSPLKRYRIENGVSIAIPGDWKTVKPSGPPYVFEAQDRKHAVRFVISQTQIPNATEDTLDVLARTTVKNLREKLADSHFALVSNKIVKLPAGRAARIVYRATLTHGGRAEFLVYELLRRDHWYVLEYQAGSLSTARAYGRQFTQSARSLRLTD